MQINKNTGLSSCECESSCCNQEVIDYLNNDKNKFTLYYTGEDMWRSEDIYVGGAKLSATIAYPDESYSSFQITCKDETNREYFIALKSNGGQACRNANLLFENDFTNIDCTTSVGGTSTLFAYGGKLSIVEGEFFNGIGCIGESFVTSQDLSGDINKVLKVKKQDGSKMCGYVSPNIIGCSEKQEVQVIDSSENFLNCFKSCNECSEACRNSDYLPDNIKQMLDNEVIIKDNINGVGFIKDVGDKPQRNYWVNAGVMVYSYSKRILWEYIRPLPNQSDDIIHIETDGLYFPAKYVEDLKVAVSKENYKGDYGDAIGFGSALGNVKTEHISDGASYWLGKKFYYMYCGMEKEHVIKIKGVPTKTIDASGTTYKVVEKIDYEKVYNGESVAKSFSTLHKTVFGAKPEISSLRMTRTINPMCDYSEYN